MEVGMDFGWLMDRFLVDFGPKLGVKLGPSWHQDRRKFGTKTMSKKHENLEPRVDAVARHDLVVRVSISQARLRGQLHG